MLLKVRYAGHHQQLIGKDLSLYFDPSKPLEERLFQWFEWITPFTAHYYVPMFVIDALHTSIFRDIHALDPLNADQDLFELSTAGITSLIDLLNNELRKLKKCSSYKECAPQLQELARQYGFLKCRHVFESPYTPEDLFEMVREVPDEPLAFDHADFEEKREKNISIKSIYSIAWAICANGMRIAQSGNGISSLCLFGCKAADSRGVQRPFDRTQHFLRSSKEALLSALKFGIKPTPIDRLTILKANGKMIFSDQLQIRVPSLGPQSSLKGRTVYGKGILQAQVQVAFSPEELSAPAMRPCVLVTGMTTPDLIPYIRKHFDALITDEGGILCHAAIVAREIPIPCIVGTGVGSSILSSGTTVRIDFDRAEIRIV